MCALNELQAPVVCANHEHEQTKNNLFLSIILAEKLIMLLFAFLYFSLLNAGFD